MRLPDSDLRGVLFWVTFHAISVEPDLPWVLGPLVTAEGKFPMRF